LLKRVKIKSMLSQIDMSHNRGCQKGEGNQMERRDQSARREQKTPSSAKKMNNQ